MAHASRRGARSGARGLRTDGMGRRVRVLLRRRRARSARRRGSGPRGSRRRDDRARHRQRRALATGRPRSRTDRRLRVRCRLRRLVGHDAHDSGRDRARERMVLAWRTAPRPSRPRERGRGLLAAAHSAAVALRRRSCDGSPRVCRSAEDWRAVPRDRSHRARPAWSRPIVARSWAVRRRHGDAR